VAHTYVAQLKAKKNSKKDAPPAPSDGISSPAPSQMRSKAGKEVMEAAKSMPAVKMSAEEKKDKLLSRLSLTVDQRRALAASKEGGADKKVQKALKGHNMKKTKFNMAEKYGGGAKCDTCSSTDKCEEDVDNKGVFYCAKCWDAYDDEPADAKQTPTRRSLSELAKEKKPAPIATVNTSGNPKLPTSPPTKQELTQQLKSPPPPPGAEEDEAAPEFLWVMHDNPTLAGQVGGKSMPCLLETKDHKDKDVVRIVHGLIEFCGPTPVDTDRGTECLRLKNLVGYTIDKKTCETRVAPASSNIIEYRFCPEGESGISLSGDGAEMSVLDFLSRCDQRVDVILDPHRDGDWYPFKEATRSMAPQFKSNGVGYIRLGDDMSSNGVAFLSHDGCNTFFSSQSITPTAQPPAMKKEKSGGVAEKVERMARVERAESGSDSELEFDDVEDEVAANLLRDLQQTTVVGSSTASMKWHEKVDVITKLGKVVGMKKGRDIAGNTLTTLQDIMNGKNVNVHVLRASVISIGRIGYGLRKALVKEASWRTIMVELLKLLKSKQVMEEAKQTLKMLHGRCFTLKNVLPIVNDCLGIAKKGVKGGKVGPGGGGGMGGGGGLGKGKAAGSTTEIVEWLADAVEEERYMRKREGGLDAAGMRSIVDLFLTCVANRDVKCRRAAQEGLVGVLVFGVMFELVERSKAFDLVDSLEQSNLKIFEAIKKNVSAEIVSRKTEMELAEGGGAGRGSLSARGSGAGNLSSRGNLSARGMKVEKSVEGDLANMWGEVQYLLRKKPERSGDVEDIIRDVESSLYFLNTLEVEAKRMGMLRGGLSRCVLPYDENTSTLDQANVANGPASHDDLDKMDLDAGTKEKMRAGAMKLRALVRVKIADDGDLDLAMVAVGDVEKFFTGLKREAAKTGKDAFEILGGL